MQERSIAPTSAGSPWRKRIAGGGVLLSLGALAVVVRLAMASSIGNAAAATNGSTQLPSLGGQAPSVPGAASSLEPAARNDAGAADERAALGRKIFFDGTLSDPPGTSCASCHDPAHGFAGNNGSVLGVAQGSRPKHFARRSTPSVLYLRFVPRFHFHWEEDVDLPDGVGGFFWDGRTDSLAALAAQPLLNPDEM